MGFCCSRSLLRSLRKARRPALRVADHLHQAVEAVTGEELLEPITIESVAGKTRHDLRHPSGRFAPVASSSSGGGRTPRSSTHPLGGENDLLVQGTGHKLPWIHHGQSAQP
jgi:hypothetical protein